MSLLTSPAIRALGLRNAGCSWSSVRTWSLRCSCAKVAAGSSVHCTSYLLARVEECASTRALLVMHCICMLNCYSSFKSVFINSRANQDNYAPTKAISSLAEARTRAAFCAELASQCAKCSKLLPSNRARLSLWLHHLCEKWPIYSYSVFILSKFRE
jgi:hypothetical protein